MKVFKTEEYNRLENPTPGEFYRTTILSEEHKAKDLGGIFGLLVPGSEVPLHIHNKRESIFIPISGEVTVIYEDQESTVKVGDVVYMPPGKKHGLVNRSDKDMRYIEFLTYPPVEADFIKVE
jgi:quercetin dioxygenase-like cupin family protein